MLVIVVPSGGAGGTGPSSMSRVNVAVPLSATFVSVVDEYAVPGPGKAVTV